MLSGKIEDCPEIQAVIVEGRMYTLGLHSLLKGATVNIGPDGHGTISREHLGTQLPCIALCRDILYRLDLQQEST